MHTFTHHHSSDYVSSDFNSYSSDLFFFKTMKLSEYHVININFCNTLMKMQVVQCFLLSSTFTESFLNKVLNFVRNDFLDFFDFCFFHASFLENGSHRFSTGSFARLKQNFPENQHFLPPDTHIFVCILRSKKC